MGKHVIKYWMWLKNPFCHYFYLYQILLSELCNSMHMSLIIAFHCHSQIIKWNLNARYFIPIKNHKLRPLLHWIHFIMPGMALQESGDLWPNAMSHRCFLSFFFSTNISLINRCLIGLTSLCSCCKIVEWPKYWCSATLKLILYMALISYQIMLPPCYIKDVRKSISMTVHMLQDNHTSAW